MPRRPRGYNMAMVDEFLDVLTADYTTLYKENATLKAKMKVLVDKVEEYRSTEDAMRKALLTAQKMADEMVAQAESKKAEMLKDAEAQAKARMAELQQGLRDEQLRLTAAQNATAAYVSKLKELYQHEMDYLNGLSKLTAAAQPAPAADPVDTAVEDISHNVEKLVAEESAEAEAASGRTRWIWAARPGEGGRTVRRAAGAEPLPRRGGGGPRSPPSPPAASTSDHLQFGKGLRNPVKPLDRRRNYR